MVQDRASLPETLYRLRVQARLSQQKLAKLAGISEGQLGNIERGRDQRGAGPPHPKVETLRRIADGLAFDDETQTTDTEKADRYYLELATAGGLFPPSVVPSEPGALLRSARERFQALLARNPKIATAFEALPNNLDDDDVEALRRHLDLFAELVRRRQK